MPSDKSISGRDRSEAAELREQLAALLKLLDQDAGQLRQGITEILSHDIVPEANPRIKEASEALVRKLREANEHLVMATIRAQDLQAKAEAATDRQSVFLAMLAHELRNPLAPIAIAAELLGNILDVHPEIPVLQQIISRQTNHLVRLVDDLVDASRINSGKIAIRKSELQFAPLIQMAVETSQPLLDNRGQHLLLDLPSGAVFIDGDAVRLTQVFSNLLINAAKFSPPGTKVTVSARREGGSVVVVVKDEGAGIAMDMQPFIFDLFTQGPSTQLTGQGGLGIGLALVRTIVEMHGGSVEVRSPGLGSGSEFIVALPVLSGRAPAVVAGPAALPPVPRTRRHILLIDDNADLNEMLGSVLKQAGHTTASARNGPDGLALASRHKFDAVICDIGMPGMDGFEVARRLCLEALLPLPCLIAISGYNRPETRMRAQQAGFNHYLVKPVSGQELLNLIALHDQQQPLP